MPRMKFLGHQWQMGSDDLQIPSSLFAALCGAWTGYYTACYYSQRTAIFDCLQSDATFLDAYYLSTLAINSIEMITTAALVYSCEKGTIINPLPRKLVPKLVVTGFALDSLRILFTALGSFYIYSKDIPCDSGVVSTFYSAVKTSWVLCIAACVAKFIIFSRRPATYDAQKNALKKGTWTERLSKVAEFLGFDKNASLTDLAGLLADFDPEKDDVDVVPTDVLAALLLFKMRQKHKMEEGAEEMADVLKSNRRREDEPNPKEWMTKESAFHYMKYARGCYGWLLEVYDHPLSGIKLLFSVLWSNLKRTVSRPPYKVINDPALLNLAVIKSVTGLKDEDIVFVSYHNKLYQSPFYVCIDHSQKSLIVAIRGSLSLEDALTDLSANESDPIEVHGFSGVKAHIGMHTTATWFMNVLVGNQEGGGDGIPGEEEPILDLAYRRLETLVGSQRAQEYNLVVTGHSLGAGVASILTIMLRQVSKYANARCFAFSPPGALLSQSGSEYTHDFVCSVVLGDDLVARVSATSVFKLKLDLYHILRDLDLPKHKILGGWLKNIVNTLRGRKEYDQLMLENRPSNPTWEKDPEAEAFVRKYQHDIDRAIQHTRAALQALPRLYAPGCIIQIKEITENKGLFSRKKEYHAFWTKGSFWIYDDMILSPNFMDHHLPGNVFNGLEHLVAYDRQVMR